MNDLATGAAWVLGGVALLAWLTLLVAPLLSGGRPLLVATLPADGPEALPRLSIVVPALNEEETVEPAMRTLLALDYPQLEIIAVDDRSTDETGGILDRLAATDPRLRVLHVRELPAGWLGKNHALHLASREATGDYILFTDADVLFEPTVLRRTVRAMIARGLDHLAVFPELVRGGFWETLCVWFFGALFVSHQRPWKVSDPRSRAHIGVGAFNLVKSAAYRRTGGHASLPMEVLDDVKLGKRMKETGGRCDFMTAGPLVRVRWVEGVGGLIRGLTKNAFAGFGFNPALVVAATAGILLVAAWPVAGLWIGPVGARALCAAAILAMVAAAWPLRPSPRTFPLGSLLFPAAAVLFIYIILRSMVVTYRQGGVSWRGTLYRLDELRKGVV